MPAEGVVANIRMGDLDVDEWERLLSQVGDPGAPERGGRPGGTGQRLLADPDRAACTQLHRGRTRPCTTWWPGASRDGRTWRVNLDAQELNGYAEYRQPTGAGAGRCLRGCRG